MGLESSILFDREGSGFLVKYIFFATNSLRISLTEHDLAKLLIISLETMDWLISGWVNKFTSSRRISQVYRCNMLQPIGSMSDTSIFTILTRKKSTIHVGKYTVQWIQLYCTSQKLTTSNGGTTAWGLDDLRIRSIWEGRWEGRSSLFDVTNLGQEFNAAWFLGD